jgi:hypothetical protein
MHINGMKMNFLSHITDNIMSNKFDFFLIILKIVL